MQPPTIWAVFLLPALWKIRAFLFSFVVLCVALYAVFVFSNILLCFCFFSLLCAVLWRVILLFTLFCSWFWYSFFSCKHGQIFKPYRIFQILSISFSIFDFQISKFNFQTSTKLKIKFSNFIYFHNKIHCQIVCFVYSEKVYMVFPSVIRKATLYSGLPQEVRRYNP